MLLYPARGPHVAATCLRVLHAVTYGGRASILSSLFQSQTLPRQLFLMELCPLALHCATGSCRSLGLWQCWGQPVLIISPTVQGIILTVFLPSTAPRASAVARVCGCAGGNRPRLSLHCPGDFSLVAVDSSPLEGELCSVQGCSALLWVE